MRYREWVLIAILLFSVGVVFGFMPLASTTALSSESITALKQFSDILASLPPALIALFIFIKNVSALLFSFALSPILCLAPILALTTNGLLLGSVSVMVSQEKSLGFLLAGLLPHGIFELPALIIGEAAALSFGAMAIILLVQQKSRAVLVSTAKQNTGHILLSLALFFIVGIFHTVIILALLKEQTRTLLMPNLKQNLRYLVIAFALLVPAAIIETYVTPLLLT